MAKTNLPPQLFRNPPVLRMMIIIIMTNLAILLLSNTSKVSAQEFLEAKPKAKALEMIRAEKLNFKIGGGYPFTWNSSFEYVFSDAGGARIGMLAQGPQNPYNPEIPDAKPSITTYGISLGWAYQKWRSRLKGSGANWYFGTGKARGSDIKLHYNYGFALHVVGTIFQEKNYALGLYAQFKQMYQVINREQNGLTWKTSGSSQASYNLGATIMF